MRTSYYGQWLVSLIPSEKLFHPTLFTTIYGYSQLLLIIFGYFTLGHFWLL